MFRKLFHLTFSNDYQCLGGAVSTSCTDAYACCGRYRQARNQNVQQHGGLKRPALHIRTRVQPDDEIRHEDGGQQSHQPPFHLASLQRKNYVADVGEKVKTDPRYEQHRVLLAVQMQEKVAEYGQEERPGYRDPVLQGHLPGNDEVKDHTQKEGDDERSPDVGTRGFVSYVQENRDKQDKVFVQRFHKLSFGFEKFLHKG